MSVDRILVSFSGTRSLVDQGTFRLPRLSPQSTLLFQLKHTEQSVFRMDDPKLHPLNPISVGDASTYGIRDGRCCFLALQHVRFQMPLGRRRLETQKNVYAQSVCAYTPMHPSKRVPNRRLLRVHSLCLPLTFSLASLFRYAEVSKRCRLYLVP